MGNTWLVKTGQKWKMKIMYFLLVISFSMFFFGFLRMEEMEDMHFSLLYLLAIAIGFMALFVMVFFIKCHFCKKSIPLYVIKSSDYNSWLLDLYKYEHCPICGKR